MQWYNSIDLVPQKNTVCSWHRDSEYKTIKNQSKLEFETWRHQELLLQLIYVEVEVEKSGNKFLAEYSGRRIKVWWEKMVPKDGLTGDLHGKPVNDGSSQFSRYFYLAQYLPWSSVWSDIKTSMADCQGGERCQRRDKSIFWWEKKQLTHLTAYTQNWLNHG